MKDAEDWGGEAKMGEASEVGGDKTISVDFMAPSEVRLPRRAAAARAARPAGDVTDTAPVLSGFEEVDEASLILRGTGSGCRGFPL